MANQIQNEQVGRYQPYPEYKDSGVEWLGRIPSHWDLWKLKHAYNNIGSGTTPPTSTEEWFHEGTIPWVTTGELRENIITHTNKYLTKKAYDQFSALRIHPVGSIIIAMYGATIGRLGILGIPATTNQACCVVCHSTKIDNKYLFYWLYAFRNEIINLSSGGGQPNINQEKVSFLKISAPSKNEQTQIAQFLDYETAKIDLLIEKQQKLIELLKEKRQAVISHAVTKGLDPNVEMKDSGVEWLGEVPAHWEITNLKYYSYVKGGYAFPSDSFTISGVPVIRIGDITNEGEISLENCKYLPNIKEKEYKQYEIQKNKILMAMTGATIGKAGIYKENIKAYLNQRVGQFELISSKLAYSYLWYILFSEYYQEHIKLTAFGGAQPNISDQQMVNILIGLPPLQEQTQIAEYLDTQTSKIDLLIEKAEAQIALMQERRTALISAAVTGKIDLRHWQMPEASNHQGGDYE